MDTFEEEEVIPLSELAKELVAVRSEINESTDKLFNMLSELQGTTTEAQEELAQFMELFRK